MKAIRCTRVGWLYLAVILDLHSRRIVGWAMSPRQTLSLVVEAWWMAWQRRRPAPGLLSITAIKATSIAQPCIKPSWPTRRHQQHEPQGQSL